MMDHFDNEINNRILEGNFPTETLEPSDSIKVEQLDLEAMAQEGLDVLRNNPGLQ